MEISVRVVNKHTHIKTNDDFYIGRGSPIGNPFTHMNVKNTIQVESREIAVEKYRKYIYDKIKNKDVEVIKYLKKCITMAKKNGNVNLVCYCSPKKCHGEIIKEIIEYNLNKI